MKKKILLIVLLLVGVALLLYGCTNRKKTTITKCGFACELRFYREKDADKNYMLYTDYIYTTTGFYNFFYKVYNNEEIIDDGMTMRETSITRVSDDILELKLSLGDEDIVTRYYDIKNNTKSEEYKNVITTNGKYLVFAQKNKLVLKSIFDNSYYKEIKININSSDDIYHIKFNNDNKMEVIYINSSGEETKDNISL
jgi:hypothetical protein